MCSIGKKIIEQAKQIKSGIDDTPDRHKKTILKGAGILAGFAALFLILRKIF